MLRDVGWRNSVSGAGCACPCSSISLPPDRSRSPSSRPSSRCALQEVRWYQKTESRPTTKHPEVTHSAQSLRSFIEFIHKHVPDLHVVFNVRNALDTSKSGWVGGADAFCCCFCFCGGGGGGGGRFDKERLCALLCFVVAAVLIVGIVGA